GADLGQRAVVDVVDPDPPARVCKGEAQRQADVTPAPEHHKIEIRPRHGRDSISHAPDSDDGPIVWTVPVPCTSPMAPTWIQPVTNRIDRLLARLPEPVEARIRDRLGLDLFLVVAAVLVTLRLFDEFPWTSDFVDMHTYWATGDGFSYALSNPYVIGAYLYAPSFAQGLAPITSTLPWPWFAALWTAAICAAYIWLVGRWAFPLVLTGAVALELYLGQIDVFIAAAVVIGFRYPAVWAFPLLTKVAPGIGLVWFLVRREWRNLAIALTATVAVAGVSAVV